METDMKERSPHMMDMRVHTANPCCFSRDGETIAVGTEEGEIVLFDADGTKVRLYNNYKKKEVADFTSLQILFVDNVSFIISIHTYDITWLVHD